MIRERVMIVLGLRNAALGINIVFVRDYLMLGVFMLFGRREKKIVKRVRIPRLPRTAR